MATLRVHPRPTPDEPADGPVDVQVDDDAVVHAATLEDWVTPRQSWELELREG